MDKLWVLPLEPYEMRYTIQWRKWFEQILKNKGIGYEFIEGNPFNVDKIHTGEVLDVYKTNIWKLEQTAKLIKAMRYKIVQDGDKIFTFDMWHTGLEAIQYVKSMTGLKVDVYGIWHAGSYDHSDFTYRHGFEPWAFKLEQVWAQMAKKMFVGSKYHQKMIKDMRGIDTIVTGLPIDVTGLEKYDYAKKDNTVVFTSRLDPEKRPDMARRIQKKVEKNVKDVEFIYTHEHKYSKEQYYNVLGKSKIVLSTALHENFGIGVIEGISCGCYPIVPRDLSYSDYLPVRCTYTTENEAVDMITRILNARFLEKTFGLKLLIAKYEYAFDLMLKEMGYGN